MRSQPRPLLLLLLAFGLLTAPISSLTLYPQSTRSLKSATRLGLSSSTDPLPGTERGVKRFTYAEESRRYRRSIFTHDDWVAHRSPERFIRNIKTIFSSGTYRNLRLRVGLTTAFAIFLVVYNGLVGGYSDLNGIEHPAIIDNLPGFGLPVTPFTLMNPSLGILLVFRTTACYKRWDEARKNWGMNINHTRDLLRMANAYYDRESVSPERRKEDLTMLSMTTWSFVRAMKRHLSPPLEDEDDFKLDVYERLPKAQAQKLIAATHRPNRALFDLSLAIENLPMHFLRKNELHQALTIFEDNLGSSERLLTSPIPIFYSRHLSRFLTTWMVSLPLTLYQTFGKTWNHVEMIPATFLLATFLFGIEELATQMEEPFTILPMQSYSDRIGNWCNEIISWEQGDNGMDVNDQLIQHTAFMDLSRMNQEENRKLALGKIGFSEPNI